MKICSNCGKECNDDIKFCMFCGNPFPVAEDVVTPEEHAAEEVTEPQQQYTEPQQYAGPEQQYTEPQQQYTEPQQQYAGPEQQYTEPQQQYAGAQQQYGAQHYGNQPYQQYGGPAVPELGYSGFSIAALVLGLVSIFFGALFVPPVLAIIFGAIGNSKAKQGYKGRGMAIAGLVLGIVTLVIYIIMIVLAVALGLAVLSGLGAMGAFY